jgi:hypothetical protein
MNPPAEWEEIESLFHEVVDLPPHERSVRFASAP